MFYRRIKGPQTDYRLLERQRVEESSKLTEQFPQLKLMTVELLYCCPDQILKNRKLKYVVNLDNAHSVFLFGCPHEQCLRGDFDLSQKLAEALARKQTLFTGEAVCPGRLTGSGTNGEPCPNRLQYKISLGYAGSLRPLGGSRKPARSRAKRAVVPLFDSV